MNPALTFPEAIVAARYVFTGGGLYAVTAPVPRIAVETDSVECHIVGVPVGKRAGLHDPEMRTLPPRPDGLGDRAWATRAGALGVTMHDRTGANYRQSIDAALRRDVGLDPDAPTFDALALAAAWLAPSDVQRGKPRPLGWGRVRVDAHGALYADNDSALVAPHALPMDAGAVVALRPEDMALWALAVRFIAARGHDVVGRVWQTASPSGASYWTIRAGVEREDDPTAPFAALVAYSAPSDVVGDIRARALLANAQRERASFVVTREGFARLFSGTAYRALVVGADGTVSAHADGAARATSVAAEEVDGVAAVGIDGTKMRDVLDAVAGDRLRVTIADTRTPVVVSDADALSPPVFALVLPSVDAETYLAPVPPRAA
jgi:hypothetical protein